MFIMQKSGILKIVASTGGLKFLNSDEWMNPPKDFLSDMALKGIQGLRNKNVIVTFNDDGRYISCVEGKLEPSNDTTTEKSEPQEDESEAYPKMNVSVSLSKDYNTIKLELLDVAIKGDLSRRIQEKINFLKTEINKAHDNIEGEKK